MIKERGYSYIINVTRGRRICNAQRKPRAPADYHQLEKRVEGYIFINI